MLTTIPPTPAKRQTYHYHPAYAERDSGSPKILLSVTFLILFPFLFCDENDFNRFLKEKECVSAKNNWFETFLLTLSLFVILKCRVNMLYRWDVRWYASKTAGLYICQGSITDRFAASVPHYRSLHCCRLSFFVFVSPKVWKLFSNCQLSVLWGPGFRKAAIDKRVESNS